MYPQTVDCIVGIGAGALKKDIFSGGLRVADLEKADKL